MAYQKKKTYLKDKKIVIYKKGVFSDEDGFQTKGFMPVHAQPTVWAYFKQLSAELTYLNSNTQSQEECLFRINWNDFVRTATPADLAIGYNGLLYNVVRVDPYEDYKRDLTLYAKNNHEELGTVVPYDPEALKNSDSE